MKKDNNNIYGVAASKGKAKGIVKVIKNKDDYFSIGPDKIIVTDIIIPELRMVMNKVKAIIIDSGGLTSHIAKAMREMKKPCVTGTKIATKVLKDGDLVEVDVSEGVVKIIKKT